MTITGKILEAVGIACVMIGLVQGILGQTMWMELYLSVTGIVIFFGGRGLEKLAARRRKGRDP